MGSPNLPHMHATYLFTSSPFSPYPTPCPPIPSPLSTRSLPPPSETGDWDIFLSPPEQARAETGGADQWVLKRRECSGFARMNKVTSLSLGYPQSVFNKNSTLKVTHTHKVHTRGGDLGPYSRAGVVLRRGPGTGSYTGMRVRDVHLNTGVRVWAPIGLHNK